MISRRRFFCSATAAAAMLAGMPKVRGATYDLVIEGGRVIDPSLDNYKATRTGRQKLFPIVTVIGGKRAAPRV
jgi:hypothetical protein